MDTQLFRSGVDQITGGDIADTMAFTFSVRPPAAIHDPRGGRYAHHQVYRRSSTTNGSLLTPEIVQGWREPGWGADNLAAKCLALRYTNAGSPTAYEELRRVLVQSGKSVPNACTPRWQVLTMSTWSRPLFDIDRPIA